VNKSLASRVGTPPAELIGAPVLGLFQAADHPEVLAIEGRITEVGAVASFRARLQRKNGTIAPATVNATLLTLPDATRSVLLEVGDARSPVDEELRDPQGVLMQPASGRTTVNGSPVSLTRKELEVLRLLLTHRGQVVMVDSLVEIVWGYPRNESRNFVQAQISRVRAKLRAAGAANVIWTERGFGYAIW
jgi:DNA-binding response OmpR family regulator